VDNVGLLPGEILTKVLTSQELADSTDWGHKALNIAEAWKITKGKGVITAVLDTGYARNHRDLKGQVIAERSFIPGESVDDFNAHGTFCAAQIAAAANDWGMIGVASESKLAVGKVLSNQGSGTTPGIAQGIDWAVSVKARVISMSLGGPSRDTDIPPALARAKKAGAINICAAGNDGPGGRVGFPGGYPDCICVAATDKLNKVAIFSSRGERVDIAAPGVGIISAIPGPGDGLFGQMSGTSMATPYIAGLATLWLSVNLDVPMEETQDRFFEALKAVATDLPPTGRDPQTGHGIPDAYKLVTYKRKKDPVPEPMPGEKVIWTDGNVEIIVRVKKQ
jgi:subtilisin family serine protease